MFDSDSSGDECYFEADKVEDVSIILVTVITIINKISIKITQAWTMKKENDQRVEFLNYARRYLERPRQQTASSRKRVIEMEKNRKEKICKYEVTGVYPSALSRIVDEWWKAVLPFKIGTGKRRKVNVKMELD